MTSIPDNHVRDRSRVQLGDSMRNSINVRNLAPIALYGSRIETETIVIKNRNYGWLIYPALVLGFVAVGVIASI